MLFVIYVNYGQGVTFRTGPETARHRVGLWSHIYRCMHQHCGGCQQCLTRVALGQVEELPQGRQTGRMYRLI